MSMSFEGSFRRVDSFSGKQANTLTVKDGMIKSM